MSLQDLLKLGWEPDIGTDSMTAPSVYGLVTDGVTNSAPKINAMPPNCQLKFGRILLCQGPLVFKNQQQFFGLGRFVSSIQFDPTAFGPSVPLPAITGIVQDGVHFTATFAANHGRNVDDVIELFGATPDAWNDIFQVVGVPSPTTLTILCPLIPGAATTLPNARTINALCVIGPSGGLVFATRIQNLVIDCQNIPDSVGVFAEWGTLNEQAGLSDVLIRRATYRGVRLKSAQFQYDDVEIIMQPPANPVTSVASGSNGVDLQSAPFRTATGVINIPAGDIAAQNIPWTGSASIAVTGAAGFRTVFYRGTSPGTGPSGQDQLINVQTAVDVSRVMATGIAVTIANSIGEDLTVGSSGSGNTQKFGRSTVVTSHAALMMAATRINGPGNVTIDAHHTEYAHAGLIIGDKQATKGVITTGFSCASSHTISVAILNPSDGGVNTGYELSGTSGDGAAALTIVDIPNNVVLKTSANPVVPKYPLPLTLSVWQSTFIGEAQNITVTAMGGTMNVTLPAHGSIAAQTVSNVAFNVAAATLQAALIAAWGIANLTVTLAAGVYTITIPRTNGSMPQITVDTTNLTGGTATVASPNASQNVRLAATQITEQCRQTVTVPVNLKLRVRVDASMSVAALTGTIIWQIRSSLPGGAVGNTPPNSQSRTVAEPGSAGAAAAVEPIRQRSAIFLVDFTSSGFAAGQLVDLQFVFYCTTVDNLGTVYANGSGRQTTMEVTATDGGSF